MSNYGMQAQGPDMYFQTKLIYVYGQTHVNKNRQN